MIRTRLYRVALVVANAAAGALLLFDKFGPGLGISPFDIGIIDTIVNGIIVMARQIGDATTPTLPPPPAPAPPPAP